MLEDYDNVDYEYFKEWDIEQYKREIERLNNDIKELLKENGNKEKVIKAQDNIIKEVREYIENNDLYEQDYDYDYEENLVVGPPSDETARKILLGILDKEVN